MTAYVTITDVETDPDAPLTAVLGKKFRDNPIAIAEGAVGAPKNRGKSMDISAGNLSGTTPITNLGDAAKLLLVAVALHTVSPGFTASPSIGYQLSSDNGVSWGTAVVMQSYSMAATGGGATAVGTAIINMTGFNAIRLSGNAVLSGSLIWVEGE